MDTESDGVYFGLCYWRFQSATGCPCYFWNCGETEGYGAKPFTVQLRTEGGLGIRARPPISLLRVSLFTVLFWGPRGLWGHLRPNTRTVCAEALPVWCGLGRGSHRETHRDGLGNRSLEIGNFSPLLWSNHTEPPSVLPGNGFLVLRLSCLTGDFTRGSSTTTTEQKLCLAGLMPRLARVTPRAGLLSCHD